MGYRARAILLTLVLAGLLPLAGISPAAARPAADSVILFIGDGMGPNQVAMTEGAIGEKLAMQQMPFSGTVTTTSVHGDITDSAAAGTALATGHKTENGMIATSPSGQRLETILERCRKKHKSVGIITTDALTGATPASFAAHVASRGKRSEIAEQMVHSRAQVMLGYWKGDFAPKALGGEREDGKDLIARLTGNGYQVVYTRDELVKAEKPLLAGFFDDGPQAPRMVDMVKAALARLGRNQEGLFLVIEQARVDWEPGDPSAIVADVLNLDQAVATAVEFARKRGRTLVVVTADHETGGCEIVKPELLRVLKGVKEPARDIAQRLNADRTNIGQVMAEYAGLSELTAAELTQIREAKDAGDAIGAVISARAGIAWTSGGDHTATPVRVFAFGPGGDRFSGEMDNTDIPKRIAEAIGLGAFPK